MNSRRNSFTNPVCSSRFRIAVLITGLSLISAGCAASAGNREFFGKSDPANVKLSTPAKLSVILPALGLKKLLGSVA